MFQNLFTSDLGFGGRSWVALGFWVAGLLVGIYLYQAWREINPVRGKFFKRTGLGLAILSAVGIVVLLFRVIGIPVASMPVWSYLVMLVTLGYISYATWWATQRLPSLTAASRDQRRLPTQAGQTGRNSARTYNAPANAKPAKTAVPTTTPAPRPVATTSRRESRRDRKKKQR